MIIDTYEKALEVIKAIRNFRYFYEANIDEKTLINNYEDKEDIIEEIVEDQKEVLIETLDKPRKLMEEIRKLSNYNMKIKYGPTGLSSVKSFDEDNGYKLIIIKYGYDIVIEKTSKLFAVRNKNLYINVPRLIYEHFYENDQEANKLEGVYSKKNSKKIAKTKTISKKKSITNITQYISKKV